MVIFPGRFILDGPRATQSLLVERRQNRRLVGDLTGKATFRSSNPRVAAVGRDGVVRAAGDGRARVTATVGSRTATASVVVRRSRVSLPVSFSNQVMPLLTRAGCNSGACHGASAGKGGLKLTLRGYDPAADYAVLTRQALGRRVSLSDPERSLMLLKPTMSIPHGGGIRIPKGSYDYRVLRDWIADGAPPPAPAEPGVTALEVFPRAATLARGAKQRIRVQARYSDGRVEDVSRWAKYGTSDSSVAGVTDEGTATVEGSGEAAVTVWYMSRVAFATVSAPYRRPDTRVTAANQHGAPNTQHPTPNTQHPGFIDVLVDRKLATLGLPVSGLSSDAEFIRRAYLDAAGILPTPQEVRAFVADASPDRRSKLVDALLARPEFVDYWAYRWSDLLLVSSRKLPTPAMWAFYNWIRASVAANKPWDQFAREIVTATGSNLDNGAANYFVLHKSPIELTETTSQAFLGMSLTCARCHNHPLEKWTQRDYYGMANLFARLQLKNGDRRGETLVFPVDSGDVAHPRLGIPMPPRPLDGQAMDPNATTDRRQWLATWLTSPQNPYFSRAIVNRVWRNFMGRGLVEAEDDLRLTNPPSNAELFDALASDFSGHGFDVKRLIRQILGSAVYQRTSAPAPGNAVDQKYYSHYIVRRLPAEVMLDAIAQVTGVPSEFAGYPKGVRALQLADSQVASYFLSVFGRPDRVQTCSCERQEEPSVTQALHIYNGETINQRLRASGGTMDRLMAASLFDEQVLDELFLLAFSRPPTERERSAILPILAAAPATDRASRREALEDVAWSLLSNKEFLFNH
jgi:hypothetical protein